MIIQPEQQASVLTNEATLKKLFNEMGDRDKATVVAHFISDGLLKADPVRLGEFRALLDEALPYQNYIDKLLSKLETLEDFCKRKLGLALQQQYGGRFSVDDSIRLQPATAVDDDSHTYTLLQAAMLNFTQQEAAAGYFSDDSETLPKFDEQAPDDSTPTQISAQAFALLSRQLDLGGEYQKHISRTFRVSSIELISLRMHKINTKLAAYEKYFSKSNFPLYRLFTLLNLAKGNEDIVYGDLFNNASIKLYSIKLFGKYKTDAVLITCRQTDHSTKDSYYVYIPNDPGDSFYQDDSEDQCRYRLAVNFVASKELQELFISQLTHREQSEFRTLNLQSISFVENIAFIPLETGLYKHLFERHLDKLTADAGELAVAVANVNEAAYANRRENQASLAGEAHLNSPNEDFTRRLRVYATDELLALVFAGLDRWTAIEKHDALSRLLDLKKRLAATDSAKPGTPINSEMADDYFGQFEVQKHSREQPGALLHKLEPADL
ncbi:dermonecrotic toxin domain-containing protein [Pseudomonas fluorescens]|uniref:Dermonecrotic toxin N-terminal domain-containing protein n=1 Tax=Pseudomonas fluorescens TaxID=294 RepID=A0A5E6UBD4_PSEFL|nr:DUF6543 domain-containing protein [Pseudomonas fluorescens]VVN02263.1 hypothetical protein PS655_03403 [Pseudomonas fluorescens]